MSEVIEASRESSRPAVSWQQRVVEGLSANYVAITLGIFIAIGACARMIDLTGVPLGFFTDEASYGMNSDLILRTGRDEFGGVLPLFFKAFGEYKLPLFIYGEIPFIAVLGRTELAVRMSSAVFGTLTIGTTYLLAKEVFRRELPALAAAGTLAILPWHIHYSRTGFGEVVILPLIFTVAFYLLFRAMRDPRFLLPAAIAMGLTFYAYRPAWVSVPLLLGVMLIAHRDQIIANRRKWLAAAAVLALILAPIAIHLFLSDSGDRSSQASILNNKSNEGTLALFSSFYRSYFTDSFLFLHGDNSAITRHYLPGHGQLYWWQLPLLLIGAAAVITHFNRRYVFILALLLVFPLGGALSESSPISTRTILGTVAFSLLTAAGLAAIVDTLRGVVRSQALAVFAPVAIVALVAAAMFGSYMSRYFSDYPALADGYWGWQDGAEEIIHHFQAVEGDYDELVMDGDFNAPQIFIRFYAGDDCRNCVIGNYERYDSKKRQLFALRPETLIKSKMSYSILDSIRYRDGTIAFEFVEFTGKASPSP